MKWLNSRDTGTWEVALRPSHFSRRCPALKSSDSAKAVPVRQLMMPACARIGPPAAIPQHSSRRILSLVCRSVFPGARLLSCRRLPVPESAPARIPLSPFKLLIKRGRRRNLADTEKSSKGRLKRISGRPTFSEVR
jgi:hypothetical protein